MAGNLQASPLFQAFAPQGGFASGYLLYTYVAGTTTPIQTYANAGLTILNTNPITLDSYGCCLIWLNPAQSYKFNLTDASGNQQPDWPVDNIPGPLSNVGGNILPATSNVYTLGSPLFSWANLYLGPSGVPALNSAYTSYGIGYTPQTPCELAAAVLPTNYFYGEGNVLRYGADPTNTNDCSAAIKNAFKVACAASGSSGLGNHPIVYFPHGQYKVTSTHVFGNPNYATTGVIRGIKVYGDGLGSSQINLVSGSSTQLWLFDATGTENVAPYTQTYIAPVFEDLYFNGDAASYCNGFRVFTSQNGRFDRCYFNNMDIVIDFETAQGTGYLGDGWEFWASKVTNWVGAFAVFNNGQAFNFQLHGCSIEQNISGNMFQWGPNGGGGVCVFGGSLIMQNSSSQGYLVNMTQATGLADNNNSITFNNCTSISLQSQLAGLVYIGASGDEAPLVTFNDCPIQETNGTTNAKTTALIYQGHLLFNRCALTVNTGSIYAAYGPAAGGGQYGDPGSIIFNQCEVPLYLSTFCQTPAGGDGLAWGYVSARDCFASSFIAGDPIYQRYAIDFDLNWQVQGRASNGPRVKRAYFKPAQNSTTTPWPALAGTNANWICYLPQQATLIKVLVYRAATGSNIAYNLYCGNGTGGASGSSVSYGNVTSSNCNVAQTIATDNVDAPANWVVTPAATSAGVPSTAAAATVQIWSTAASVTDAEAGGLGYAYVEYY
jgi:hypothetical protein